MSDVANLLLTFNAALRFFLEIGALLVLGYWGYQYGQTILWKVGLAISIPLFVALVWGLVGSPQAPYPLGAAGRLLLMLGIFAVAVLALLDIGRPREALLFGVVAICNTLVVYIWGGGALSP